MALDWIPIVPDLPPRRAPRPPWRQWTTWRFPIVVPDLLASEGFQPVYPDRVPPRGILLRPTERSSLSAALTARVVSPVDWYQQRPDRGSDRTSLRLARSLRPAGDPPSPGAGAVVAASLAWRPQLPDRAPARRPVPLEGLGTPRFVQPLIPIPFGGCVEIRIDGSTATGWRATAATASTLLNVTQTKTDLLALGQC